MNTTIIVAMIVALAALVMFWPGAAENACHHHWNWLYCEAHHEP